MNFIKETGHFESSDGVNSIAYYVYRPENTETRAVMQISHGMCEYIERYEDLADFLCKNGIAVCGNDHLGHGASVSSDDDLGYFGPEGGWTYLPKDLHRLTAIMQEEFEGIPYIMFGHSMGSFIVRGTAVNYVTDPDKLIICGTGGPNHFSAAGLLITDILKLFKGEKYISKAVDKIAFGAFNKRFEGTSEYSWLTKNHEITEAYSKDELCTFKFTVSAMHDLVKLNRIANSRKFFKKLDKSIPVLIVSGDSDPVGDYSKGVKKVYNRLKNGRDVTLKLYENCRHEIHNDTCRNEMIEDILEFLEK